MSERIETGSTEPIVAMLLDQFGQPLTYRTNIKAKIWRISDGKYLDWNDMEFKEPANVGALLKMMGEVNPTYSPGEYRLDFDTSTIVNAEGNDAYQVIVLQDGVNGASNVPQAGEIRVGQWVDKIGSGSYTVMQSYSYDTFNGLLTGLVWIEYGNTLLRTPVSVSVTWYSDAGVQLFEISDLSPDTNGFFKIEKATVLVTNKSYYSISQVTVTGVGIISSGKGIFTVG